MKKLFVLFAIIFAFVACEKDDNELKSLEGTVWVAADSYVAIKLSFSDIEITVAGNFNDGEVVEFTGMYTYNHPKVVVDMGAGVYVLDATEQNPGIVDGNTLGIGVYETLDLIGWWEFHRVD